MAKSDKKEKNTKGFNEEEANDYKTTDNGDNAVSTTPVFDEFDDEELADEEYSEDIIYGAEFDKDKLEEEDILADLGDDIINDLKEVIQDEYFDIPVLPMRNAMLFPSSIQSITISRESSYQLINEAYTKDAKIAVFCQKDGKVNRPKKDDLYQYGTLAKVLRIFKMPDSSTTIVLQGMERIELLLVTQDNPYLKGYATLRRETISEKDDIKKQIVDRALNDVFNQADFLFKHNDPPQVDAVYAIHNINESFPLVNFICSNVRCELSKKYELLRCDNLLDRLNKLSVILGEEIAKIEMMSKVRFKTNRDIDKQQRDYFIQQQIKALQEELGINPEQDTIEMRKKASEKKWSPAIAEIFEKEIAKLEYLSPQTPDYNVQLNYLQTILSLPWGECTTDNLDIKNAKKVLDRDHYGLEKVKERILEHLAVIKMRGDLKSPIICLYGPPGVGKTSLGKSIANALKRSYVRMSLGGIHDEAEIRGHRKTYVGAMPGRILKSIIKAGSDNPVFILDEIDKIGDNSRHGDPSSALLEVLDPEQNNAFHDNFLDIDYDLSKVMFIATANDLASIPAPLLDRMELIEVSGYLTEEKIEIGRRHLLPKALEANGLSDENITIRKNTLEKIIENYTRESGVRTFEKKISKILRRLACQKATDGVLSTRIVKPENLQEFLGPKEFSRDKYQGNEYAGVVTGLAWTAVGGEILFIETSLSPGKETKLTLTGNLGEVMKESAMLALEYIKAHSDYIGINNEVFQKWNVHIHAPEGAIPKDGPSAGITMVTALASAFTQRKVKANLAMTGEITLRGKVLPVGGIKEKILAAKRAGIKEIILCEENRRNIEVIPEIYVSGLTFHYVTDIKEVLDIALLKEKVKNPINL